MGAKLIRWDSKIANKFALDFENMVKAIEESLPDLIYLVSPVNPTGVQWPRSKVEALANRFPDTTIILDEGASFLCFFRSC
jgi:histidinol-phosphate/aromatic aminotransferase/cobyric acid decarboxylase-like protein